jgi:MFS superfamily sulfate permease-like transporter
MLTMIVIVVAREHDDTMMTVSVFVVMFVDYHDAVMIAIAIAIILVSDVDRYPGVFRDNERFFAGCGRGQRGH